MVTVGKKEIEGHGLGIPFFHIHFFDVDNATLAHFLDEEQEPIPSGGVGWNPLSIPRASTSYYRVLKTLVIATAIIFLGYIFNHTTSYRKRFVSLLPHPTMTQWNADNYNSRR